MSFDPGIGLKGRLALSACVAGSAGWAPAEVIRVRFREPGFFKAQNTRVQGAKQILDRTIQQGRFVQRALGPSVGDKAEHSGGGMLRGRTALLLRRDRTTPTQEKAPKASSLQGARFGLGGAELRAGRSR